MDANSSTTSSSADIAADILRLIPPYEHEAFRGRELPADEMVKLHLQQHARRQSARGTNFSNMGCQEPSVLSFPSPDCRTVSGYTQSVILALG
jgi:hypothetical protein